MKKPQFQHVFILSEKYENCPKEMPVGLKQLAVFPDEPKLDKKGKIMVENKIRNTVIYRLAGVEVRTKIDAFVFNEGNFLHFHN